MTTIARRTDADALINRRYSRGDGSGSVAAFAGATAVRTNGCMHRPDVCYAGRGSDTSGSPHRRIVLARWPGQAPMQHFPVFARMSLTTESGDSPSLLHRGRPALRRPSRCCNRSCGELGGAVNYLGRVLIASPNCRSRQTDSSTERVCAISPLTPPPQSLSYSKNSLRVGGASEFPMPLQRAIVWRTRCRQPFDLPLVFLPPICEGPKRAVIAWHSPLLYCCLLAITAWSYWPTMA